jgi:hypothetical protein
VTAWYGSPTAAGLRRHHERRDGSGKLVEIVRLDDGITPQLDVEGVGVNSGSELSESLDIV